MFIRELKSENIQRFRQEISVVSWGTVFEQTDPSIAFEKFSTIVADIYNSACPVKQLGSKRILLLLLITHCSTKPPEANTATHAPPPT